MAWLLSFIHSAKQKNTFAIFVSLLICNTRPSIRMFWDWKSAGVIFQWFLLSGAVDSPPTGEITCKTHEDVFYPQFSKPATYNQSLRHNRGQLFAGSSTNLQHTTSHSDTTEDSFLPAAQQTCNIQPATKTQPRTASCPQLSKLATYNQSLRLNRGRILPARSKSNQ